MTEIQSKLLFIQNLLKEFTSISNSTIDIEKTYLKLFSKLQYKKTIMIAGSQGSGKSTISLIIKKYFKKYYSKNVVVLSIDDFYLSSFQRKQLAKKFETNLFETRGVPGTHNLKLLYETIDRLKKKNFPVYIPIFDKISDSNKNHKRKVNKADLIILEGWCVGSKPIELKYLKKNVNNLEKSKDANLIWRTAYNNALVDYQKLFNKFNYYIFIKLPNWKYVINWKYKQELGLRSVRSDNRLKNKLYEFIQYYEKLSKWMSLSSPNFCDTLIKLDKNQKIKKIIFR
jgi:D-glycerate 3-kinase